MPQTNTILLLLHARPAWLALSREERAGFFRETFLPLTQKFSHSCSFRLFDSEFYHARISDFLLIETSKLDDYQDFIEMLRDTPFYSVPYFDVVDIIPAKENAFRQYDEKLGIA